MKPVLFASMPLNRIHRTGFGNLIERPAPIPVQCALATVNASRKRISYAPLSPVLHYDPAPGRPGRRKLLGHARNRPAARQPGGRTGGRAVRPILSRWACPIYGLCGLPRVAAAISRICSKRFGAHRPLRLHWPNDVETSLFHRPRTAAGPAIPKPVHLSEHPIAGGPTTTFDQMAPVDRRL